MIIIGRVTKDAVVNQLKDGRKVVNFTVAINDYYKPKGKEQGIKVTTFVNCSYWINTTVAERLKKGVFVEVSGRLSVNAYVALNNEPKASLNCHVKTVDVYPSSKQETNTTKKREEEPIDDLPF